MDFQKFLDNLLPLVGNAGIEALSGLFKDLAADQDEPWAESALALLADALYENGLDGIELARQAIHDLLDGETPEIDWANPRTASDIVAQLQNIEADNKDAVRDFFAKIGDALGLILAGIVKGLTGRGV